LKKQTQYLNILLAAMIVWVPNQLHLPADLGAEGATHLHPPVPASPELMERLDATRKALDAYSAQLFS